MSEGIDSDDELATTIAAIYTGPLEDFVARRDGVVKELRAAGRRDDAALVKGLRKPKRMAWALDVVSREDPAGMRRVEDAVMAAAGAQSGDGDLRASLKLLRDAVRVFASDAAGAAVRSGISLDDGELINAIMAVVASRDAFDLLRSGRLVDIPEAGGLELLAGPRSSQPAPTSARAASPTGPSVEEAEEAASRELLRLAIASLDSLQKALAAAERMLRNAEAEAESAERKLEHAAREAAARRLERDEARSAVDALAGQVLEAENAVHVARVNVSG